ncbi:hypothetical protein DI09_1p250 [Mitosporidium daphniae]|uniref:Adenylosuccinate lyase C-terminal domain-containing protein n=1 Tax=Mitosporidium daphniae TaxID=1485682 RepID=A0A098VT64_9MICR|nr:uncharacterized protein DI09_1p250 [Mitosporidium daphniae]KGG52175.1 hypothetical protein DI09_1p250 [Mitosporidium daphniae]|eukprot:XP_013238602.1 uncharacterized protein DI09_1p250 [Mitosporidium daphniae]
MQRLFSDNCKYSLWRQLWFNLAKAQYHCGVSCPGLTCTALDEMELHLLDPIDYDQVQSEEKRLKHDVMAHLSVWGSICPLAKPIMHLGATSCDITDNADCIIARNALKIILARLYGVIRCLRDFSMQWNAQPTLGYTHFQSAQLTTVGKRAATWLQDLVSDFTTISQKIDQCKMRGLKGTTGTQASFVFLFGGVGVPSNDTLQSIDQMENLFCSYSGFDRDRIYPVTGQTTPRKFDIEILAPLASLAATANKICTDIRLLAHSKQLEEQFSEFQVGSSAMAYKRNPIKSERCCSLSRHLMAITGNAYTTLANQWLERSLDDSASRRITIAESFLCADSILLLLFSIISNLQVYPEVLNSLIGKEFHFQATEAILMAVVKKGGDRQVAHEIIRSLSMEINQRRMSAHQYADGFEDETIPLLDRLKSHPYFAEADLSTITADLICGRASQQTTSYIQNTVDPILEKYQSLQSETPDPISI